MLKIRAKKTSDVGYAVNVDYEDVDGYADILNMLCAINEDIITTLYKHQPEGATISTEDYCAVVANVLSHIAHMEDSADGVQVQQQPD